MSKMKDPTAANDLSYHLFSVHGGWYEDGLSYQILKTVKLVGPSPVIISLSALTDISCRRTARPPELNWRRRGRK